jgi:hypothetical protein
MTTNSPTEVTQTASEMPLRWTRGGEASLLAMDEKTVTFLSTVPHPPGARVEGIIVAGEVPVKFKSHGSRRREDGLFVILGRPVDQTREHREALRATLPTG